jgi:hypothetical protein
MAGGESYWIERAQSAEAALSTCRDNQDRVKEKLRGMMETLGAKEKGNGSIDINYDTFVERLGIEGALAVRAIIDQKYSITGAAGEKPRVKVAPAS